MKTETGVSIQVCQKFLLKTFSISEGRVHRAQAKLEQNKSPGENLCGAKGCSSGKVSEKDTKYVIEHINSFPAYISHYTRKHNENRKYLNDSLNIRKMFSMYEEKCQAEGRAPQKEHYYRYIFNTTFNLHFSYPK